MAQVKSWLTREEAARAYGRMPPLVQEEFRALIARRMDAPPLAEFINEVSSHLPPPPHIEPVLEIVQRARRERMRVCIDMPPRHAKTTTLLHGFAYWLRQDPADTCAYFTYSDRQGRSKSRIARRIAREAGVELDRGSNDMSEWRTSQGGGLIAGGAGGLLTGQGVQGLFVVDDPYPNRAKADSVVYREMIWEWFTEVVLTRDEGASYVVMHTRWHDADLIGKLTKECGWQHISLTAIAEEGDVLGREVGEALWPERFPVEDLESKKIAIGEWSFASLYQGRPQPRGSRIFQEPARFVLPDTPTEWREFLHGKYLAIGVDLAASEKTHADYSAAVVIAKDGLGPLANTWVLRVERAQLSIPMFAARLRELQKNYNALLVIEVVGGFKATPQMLKHVDPSLRIIEVTPTTDKFQRSQGVASSWNSGKVFVPVGEPWVDAFLQEVLNFSGVKDPNDDQVDALAHAWNALAETRPRAPRGYRMAGGPFG